MAWHHKKGIKAHGKSIAEHKANARKEAEKRLKTHSMHHHTPNAPSHATAHGGA